MIHILICDDIKQHANETVHNLVCQAAAHDETVDLTIFTDAAALLRAMQDQPDLAEIAVLDIAMDEMDGITLAKHINTIAPRCQIIFLTCYVDYAMDAYDAEHVCFVLKKALEERMWPAIEKAHAKYMALEKAYFTATTTGGARIFPFSDICYFERSGRKTRIKTVEEDFWISDRLPGIAAQNLPEHFLRCHQSFIVNLDYVRGVERNVFYLRDGTVIPISRAYSKASFAAFWRNINASIVHE